MFVTRIRIPEDPDAGPREGTMTAAAAARAGSGPA